jgi:putative membrane protein
MYDGHWFGGGFMWIFLIILAIFVLWGTKAFNGNNNNTIEKRPSALDILKERYAKGEINDEEYKAKKRDLIS